MSNVEEKALKLYPMIGSYDNLMKREGFIEGYEQSEEDIALTWEDVHTIAIIEDRLIHELCLDDQTLPQTQEFYQEVLKRFNAMKSHEKK